MFWARRTGRLLDGEEFDAAWHAQGRRGGAEHQVYYDSAANRWFKRYVAPDCGLLAYIHRIANHNWLFPAAELRLEGVIQDHQTEFTDDGGVSIVVSQAHVRKAGTVSGEDIARMMEGLGFRRAVGRDSDPTGDWILDGYGLRVSDLGMRNAVMTSAGPVVIDPYIEYSRACPSSQAIRHEDL